MTLLELLVVVALMAVLATVAITATGNVASQSHFEQTQTVLKNIEDAVLGPSNLRQSDGTPLVTGFIADMGRVPQAWDEGGGLLSLRELLDINFNTPWAPTVATTNNCGNCTNLFDGDSTVTVYTGWRGPYLRLPPGESSITDGWGRVLGSGAAGMPHLFTYTGPGQVPVTTVGQFVNGVTDYGIDETNGGTGYSQDLSIQFDPSRYTSLIVGSVSIITTGSTFANTSTTTNYNPLFIRVYGPSGNDASKIRCDTLIINLTTNILTTNYTFSGLVQGPKVIRAVMTNSASVPQRRWSSPINVMLVPGNNTINVSLDRAL